MARVFALADPPKSRLMAFYGESFPNFIVGFPPALGVPYLANVARLEYLRVLATIAAEGKGFTVGASMAARTVYVLPFALLPMTPVTRPLSVMSSVAGVANRMRRSSPSISRSNTLK
mgnify:CR=1 FL=1